MFIFRIINPTSVLQQLGVNSRLVIVELKRPYLLLQILEYIEESRNGVLVQSKNAKRVYYEKAIDISDNTKDDLLFELQITPSESGTMELQQFLIRFEDWSDPDNYFEISLVNYPWGQSANGIVSVKTDTVSQYRSTSYKVASIKDEDNVVVDYEVTTSNTTDTQHGTVVECSFDGRNATAYHTVTNSVRFYYDNAEKTVYVANVYDWSGALTEKGYNAAAYVRKNLLNLFEGRDDAPREEDRLPCQAR